MEENFYLNQIFNETYPPEAADWCNSSHKYYITEIEPADITRHKTKTKYKENGTEEIVELPEMETVTVRRFQILEVPAPTTEELEERLRSIRNSKLAECDYITCGDLWASMESTKKEEWSKYRQALRDITSQEGFPWDGGGKETPWPVKPE